MFLGGLRVHQGEVAEGGELAARALVDPTQLSHPFAVHHGHLFRVLALGMGGRPRAALAEAELGHQRARAAGEQGERSLTVHDNLRSWVLRHLGAFGEADDHTARALERASGQRDRQGETWDGGHAWHHRQRFGTLRPAWPFGDGRGQRAWWAPTPFVESGTVPAGRRDKAPDGERPVGEVA